MVQGYDDLGDAVRYPGYGGMVTISLVSEACPVAAQLKMV